MTILCDFLILAQTSLPTSQPATETGWDAFLHMVYANKMIIPLIVIFVVMMVFSSRSKKNAEKEKLDMLKNMKKGDRVQTIGGILGTVVEARDKEIVVKVDESSNTKIRFSREAIRSVIKDEAPRESAK